MLKQRFISILLTLCVLLTLSSVGMAEGENTVSAPAVQILSVLEGEGEVSVVFVAQNWNENQKITILCERDGSAADDPGAILYVGEWQGISPGLNTKTFPVDPEQATGNYVVWLGGEGVDTPSRYAFTFGSPAVQGGMAMPLNITCGQLLEQLGMTDGSASVLVDGQPLNPDDLIPAGATLTIRIQEQEITSILYVTGDVTKDRAINASDALSVLQQVVGLISLDQVQSFAADVDRNGQISTVDALLVLQYTVNLIDHF